MVWVAAWQQKRFAVMMGFDRVQRDPTFGSWSTVGWRFSREPVGRVLAREVVHPDGEWDPVALGAGECGRSRMVIVADPPHQLFFAPLSSSWRRARACSASTRWTTGLSDPSRGVRMARTLP
jgi:hypothetical protein